MALRGGAPRAPHLSAPTRSEMSVSAATQLAVSMLRSYADPNSGASRHQDDLPVMPRLQHRLVAARGLAERQLLGDHRAERAVAQPLHEHRVDAGELERARVG